MEIPRWLNGYLTKAQCEKIEETIKEVELKTSGEVVPMVVRRSATIGHVPVLLAHILLVLLLAIDIVLLEFDYDEQSFGVLLVGLVVVAALALLLSRLPFVQRWLTSKDDLIHQVNMRAEVEFYEAGLKKTAGGTGVLIFVSLMEHRAVVLADDTIANKLTPDTWNEIVSLLVQGIRRKDMGQGFISAIRKTGEILAEHFPVQEDDQNELFDHLIIKE